MILDKSTRTKSGIENDADSTEITEADEIQPFLTRHRKKLALNLEIQNIFKFFFC